jgi:hypothetical protein
MAFDPNIDAKIAALKDEVDRNNFVDPVQVRLLANLQQAKGASSGDSGGSTDGILADVASGIDRSADINSIVTSLANIFTKLSIDLPTQATLNSILTALNTGTTHTDLAGLQSTLDAILAEQRDDAFITSTLWEDRSSTAAVFYREERVRSQDDGSVSTIYTRLSDNTIVGSLPAGSIPVLGANDRQIRSDRWKAQESGTGYSPGDWLINTIIFDTDGNGAVLSSTWYNLTTSSAIASAPLPADLADPNDQLLANVGHQSDAAATSDTGSFGVIALIKRFLSQFNILLNRIPSLAAGRIPVVADAGDNLNTSALALESGGNLAELRSALTSTPNTYFLPLATGNSRTITLPKRCFIQGVNAIYSSSATPGNRSIGLKVEGSGSTVLGHLGVGAVAQAPITNRVYDFVRQGADYTAARGGVLLVNIGNQELPAGTVLRLLDLANISAADSCGMTVRVIEFG